MKEYFMTDLQILNQKLEKVDFISLLHLIWIGRDHISPQYYHSTVVVPYLHKQGHCTPGQDTELYMPCLGLLALLKNGDYNGIQANQYKDKEESCEWLRTKFKKQMKECMETIILEEKANREILILFENFKDVK